MGSSKVVRLPNTGNAIKAYFPGVFILMQSAVTSRHNQPAVTSRQSAVGLVD